MMQQKTIEGAKSPTGLNVFWLLKNGQMRYKYLNFYVKKGNLVALNAHTNLIEKGTQIKLVRLRKKF